MKFRSFVAAAALAAAASSSLAEEPTPPPVLVSLSAGSPGVLSGSFSSTVNGLFIDSFVFDPATFTGNISVSLTVTEGPVNLFVGTINDESFGFFPEDGQSVFTFQSFVTADEPLTLSVFGAAFGDDGITPARGVYSGTVTASLPVPEPGTYALMLAGLLGMALVVRQRRARG